MSINDNGIVEALKEDPENGFQDADGEISGNRILAYSPTGGFAR